jgi:IS1 family transposase
VLLLRGIAKGEPTARQARELGMSCKQLHILRQRIQANLNETAPTGVMTGTAFEADELYQNAGEKTRLIATPLIRHANKRKRHSTYANDRPPIISVMSRETGEQRFWVCDHADKHTCSALIAENVPLHSAILYTDARQSYHSGHPVHATICHAVHEWTRDEDRDRRRGVHCNTCEGAGAALRPYLRALSTSSTCISMWRRMHQWSMPNASCPI